MTEFTPNVPFPKGKKPVPTVESVDAPLSKGEFFAHGRAQVDLRRDHLARMGMDPRHVEALRMPAPERPTAPPVHADALPEPNQAATPRKLPALAGVDFGIGAQSDEGPKLGNAARRRPRAEPPSGTHALGDAK